MQDIHIEASQNLNPRWWVVWLDNKLRLAFSLAVNVKNSSLEPFSIRNMFLEGTVPGMEFPDIREVKAAQEDIQYLGGAVRPIIVKPYENLTATAFATGTNNVCFQIDRITFEHSPTSSLRLSKSSRPTKNA